MPHRLQVLLLVLLAAGISRFATSARAALPPDFVDEQIASGLSQPTSLAFLPDGRVLVVEQVSAKVRLIVNGTVSPINPITVPGVNTSGSERGLLGITVDPRWPTFPYVYVMYSRVTNKMVIVRYTASGDVNDAAGDSRVRAGPHDMSLDAPDSGFNPLGGTLGLGPDGMLYASLGDDALECAAQDSTDLRGVLLRMDVSGVPAGGFGPPDKEDLRPASGNPYPPDNANAGISFAMGLRNPFRFAIDPWDGNLYVGDVGFNTFEELSEVTGGENLGWPYREGFAVRTSGGCTEPGGSGNYPYDDPILDYARTGGPYAIIAAPFYRPVGGGVHSFPISYSGVAFYFDYYKGFLRGVKKSGSTWVPLSVPGQPNATDWGTGYSFIGDMIVGPDGAMYYVTQGSGQLRRIRYAGEVNAAEPGLTPPLRAFPNPLRSGAVLTVELPEDAGTGTLAVYDALGRRIRSLPVAGRIARWNGDTERGGAVAPGAYFLRLTTPAGVAGRRVVVLP